eukprot:Skav203541  [mRNA]  locus=scaffold220:9115:14359:+ [translate_table: standard]
MQRPVEAAARYAMPPAVAPAVAMQNAAPAVTQLQLPQGVPKRKGLDIPIREMKVTQATPLRPTGLLSGTPDSPVTGGQVPKSELTKTPRDEEDEEPLFPMELSRHSKRRRFGSQNHRGNRLWG